jgi:D-ribose pyranose/furanose isomerase RbsD
MAIDRKLIDYLPRFTQTYREIATIMETEQFEIDRAWLEAENALADQFILEATERGVKRWESMLGISPKDTNSLEERKFRILTRLNQELPYTLRKLEVVLTNLCGENGFSVNVQSENYTVNVTLAVENQNNYQEVVEVLDKMIPANMIKHVQIMYAQHKNLTKYTHKQLAAYKHGEIKEVFANG